MDRLFSVLMVASIMVAGMFGPNLEGVASQNDRGEHHSKTFIKVGNHYIRHININYIIENRTNMVLVFQGDNQLKLDGAEAAEFRRWLGQNSIDVSMPRPGEIPSVPRLTGSGPQPGLSNQPRPKDDKEKPSEKP